MTGVVALGKVDGDGKRHRFADRGSGGDGGGGKHTAAHRTAPDAETRVQRQIHSNVTRIQCFTFLSNCRFSAGESSEKVKFRIDPSSVSSSIAKNDRNGW